VRQQGTTVQLQQDPGFDSVRNPSQIKSSVASTGAQRDDAHVDDALKQQADWLHKLERDDLEMYDMVKELKKHMGKQGATVQLQQDHGFDSAGNPSQLKSSVASTGST
jgi:hypothetical protein